MKEWHGHFLGPIFDTFSTKYSSKVDLSGKRNNPEWYCITTLGYFNVHQMSFNFSPEIEPMINDSYLVLYNLSHLKIEVINLFPDRAVYFFKVVHISITHLNTQCAY